MMKAADRRIETEAADALLDIGVSLLSSLCAFHGASALCSYG